VIDFTVVTEQWGVDPDFGMNGLYFDLKTRELVDRYNSLHDIENKIIRTIKDPFVQFKDEPQMMFRAIKAACQFDFTIEENTLAAMKKLSGLTENVMGLVVNNTFEGLTEWFVNNIFRGLKYNPALFEKLWKETGIMKVFVKFISNRLEIKSESKEVSQIFKEKEKYEYEEALSMFFGHVTKSIDPENSQELFEKTVKLFRLTETSKYGDFVIDTQKIIYLA